MNFFIMSFLLTLFLQNTYADALPFVTQSDDEQVCQNIASDEIENYERLVERFGGKKASIDQLERNESGLQKYLKGTGVRFFSAKEIMTPNSQIEALKCGLDNLIPPQCIWANAGALLSLFDRIREKISGPIFFRNWWRPTCYNSLVDGAKASDHLLAKSFDIDFVKPQDRAIAQKFLCTELWKKKENIQVGMGCTSLHVGLASPRGKRFWFYSSMKDCPVKSLDNCWEP